MYEFLILANGILLLACGRVLMWTPVVDRLRFVGSWMVITYGIRQIYVAVRLFSIDVVPSIPVLGWITEGLIFGTCLMFIHVWVQQQRAGRAGRHG